MKASSSSTPTTTGSALSSPSESTFSGSASASTAPNKKKECHVFEPQQWRKSVCRNCFRTNREHMESSTDMDVQLGSVGLAVSKQSSPSPKTSPLLGTKGLKRSDSSPINNNRRKKMDELTAGSSSGKKPSAHSPRMEKRGSLGSNRPIGLSAVATSASLGNPGNPIGNIGGVGGGNGGGGTPRTPRRSPATSPSTSAAHMGLYRNNPSKSPGTSTSSINRKYLEELENDFFNLEDKYDQLHREKMELAELSDVKTQDIHKLKEQTDEYKTKISQLEKHIFYLEEEIKNYKERLKLPESDQNVMIKGSGTSETLQRSMTESSTSSTNSARIVELEQERQDLRNRLDEIEQLCTDLMEENEVLKEEVNEMQREIEEMHDHFQEDDMDTLRELRKEYEMANKNCRIFQFKLRKAERRYEQCETDRQELEDKVRKLENQMYNEGELTVIKDLEVELKVAKEVSVRLNTELDMIDEKKSFYEEENRQLREKLDYSEKRRLSFEIENTKNKQEVERLRSTVGPMQLNDKKQTRNRLTPETLSREPSFEDQTLQREIDAMKEREIDLTEQLKFSEEEIRKLKRRLNDVESENDTVTTKLEKLMSERGSPRKSQYDIDNDSESEEDENVEAIKIQVELLEQENSLLRKKITVFEKENTSFLNEIRQLQTQNTQLKMNLDYENNNQSGKGAASVDESAVVLKNRIQNLELENKRLEYENYRLSFLSNITSGTDKNLHEFEDKLTGKSSNAPSSNQSPTQRFLTGDVDAQQNHALLSNLREEKLKLKKKNSGLEKRITQLTGDFQTKLTNLLNRSGPQTPIDSMNALMSKTGRIEVDSLRVRISALTEELESMRNKSTPEIKTRKYQYANASAEELDKASKITLLHEIGNLEEDYETIYEDYKTSERNANSYKSEIESTRNILEELRKDYDNRENELMDYIDKLQSKSSLVENLLEVVQDRANELQEEYDKFIATDSDTSDKTKQSETSIASGLSMISTGCDNVFDEKRAEIDQKILSEELFEKLKCRIRNLESLLNEERQRTRVVEKQMEMSLKDATHSHVNSDTQVKDREIEMLKQEVREKSETIEEKDMTIEDLKVRLQQMKKLNESLRILVDQEDSEINDVGKLSPKIKTSSESSSDQSVMVELMSYKKELELQKSEFRQAAIKLNESEKIKEKLSKEIRNLKAELKVREDSIFDQDDELENKNNENRKLRRQLEEMQQKQSSMKQIQEQKEEQINYAKENKVLTEKIRELLRSLDESKISCKQNEDQKKQAHDAIRTRDERIREKDDVIKQLTQSVQAKESQLRAIEELKMTKDDTIRKLQNELEKLNSRTDETSLERRPSKSLRRDDSLEDKSHKIYIKPPIDQKGSNHKQAIINEQVLNLQKANVDLKIQNEAIQNNFLEFQRKYASLKEQYEVEQDAWLAERAVLNLRTTENNEKRGQIEVLQQTTQNLEKTCQDKQSDFNTLKIEMDQKVEKLNEEIASLKKKLGHHEEHQKMPKVLQRFSGSSRISSKINLEAGSSAAGGVASTRELDELRVKLSLSEKSIGKLRSESMDREKSYQTTMDRLLQEKHRLENHLQALTEDMKDLKMQLIIYQSRENTVKERFNQEYEDQNRERKIWQEERMQLQYRIEENRIFIENWLNQIKDLKYDEIAKTIPELKRDMEKFSNIKESVPYSHFRRKQQSTNNIDLNYFIGANPSSVNNYNNNTNSLGRHQKTSSLDWTKGFRSGIGPSRSIQGGTPASAHSHQHTGEIASLNSSYATTPQTPQQYVTQMSANNAVSTAVSPNQTGGVGGPTAPPTGDFGGSNLSILSWGNRSVDHGEILGSGGGGAGNGNMSAASSVHKITNYPDPPSGFMLLSPSKRRFVSQDSMLLPHTSSHAPHTHISGVQTTDPASKMTQQRQDQQNFTAAPNELTPSLSTSWISSGSQTRLNSNAAARHQFFTQHAQSPPVPDIQFKTANVALSSHIAKKEDHHENASKSKKSATKTSSSGGGAEPEKSSRLAPPPRNEPQTAASPSKKSSSPSRFKSSPKLLGKRSEKTKFEEKTSSSSSATTATSPGTAQQLQQSASSSSSSGGSKNTSLRTNTSPNKNSKSVDTSAKDVHKSNVQDVAAPNKAADTVQPTSKASSSTNTTVNNSGVGSSKKGPSLGPSIQQLRMKFSLGNTQSSKSKK